MRLLGASGPHARAALLLAVAAAAVLGPDAWVAALLVGSAACLLLVAPRRALALLGVLLLTAAIYAAVVRFAGGDLRVALSASLRAGASLSAGAWVASETSGAAWLRLAPRSLAARALATTLAIAPVLARDLDTLRDAARIRGYGRAAAAATVVPAAFVRAARRGRLADEALAQAGHPSPARVAWARHAWNPHDGLVLGLAAAVLAGCFL